MTKVTRHQKEAPRIPFDMNEYRKVMKDFLRNVPDQDVFWDALDFAEEAHDNQWRKSGDAYILHPCSVARIMVEEMDISHPEILAAALLHDTVEDVEEVTGEVVGERFGSYVQAIVEGCTKVTHVSGDKQLASKRTHRKIFSGAARRPEVMLVKLADRLHNLRTLYALPKKKQTRIADESVDIYAPLATVFGLFNMKREMYNLALLVKYPKKGAKRNNYIKQLRNGPLGSKVLLGIREALWSYELTADVSLRTKGLWAYYDAPNHLLLNRIETPMEVLIVVKDVHSCYRTLGIINETFRPIPRTIRDFIANPKPTGYQGLHARAIIEGTKFLFKIRTETMARTAQRGRFRNWTSKSGVKEDFLKEIQELLEVLGSNDSFSYRDVIAASGKKEVYAYTPRGDLFLLPYRSTVLDFAFRVHTEIGHTCLGASIRGTRVGPDHVIPDGGIIKIIRDTKPVRFEQDMIKVCQTPRARAELAKGFKKRRRKVSRDIGASLLRQEMLRYGFPFDVFEGASLVPALELFRLEDVNELYCRIGEGKLRLYEVMLQLKEAFFDGVSPHPTPTGLFNQIQLTTLDPVCVKLSSCCHPNPASKGNLGLLTKLGLSIHHKDCGRFKDIQCRRDDIVDVSWDLKATKVHRQQELRISTAIRKDVMAALGSLPEAAEVCNVQILTAHSVQRPSWRVSFSVPDIAVLQKVLRHLDRSRLSYTFFLKC